MTRAEVIAAKRTLARLHNEIRSREARKLNDTKTARLREEYAQLAQRLKTEGAKWH